MAEVSFPVHLPRERDGDDAGYRGGDGDDAYVEGGGRWLRRRKRRRRRADTASDDGGGHGKPKIDASNNGKFTIPEMLATDRPRERGERKRQFEGGVHHLRAPRRIGSALAVRARCFPALVRCMAESAPRSLSWKAPNPNTSR